MLAESRSDWGDEIEAWVRAQRSGLLRQAQAILRDTAEAEDVVQETLLAVLRQRGRRDIGNLGGYLHRAVYWNALKRRARRRHDMGIDVSLEIRQAALLDRAAGSRKNRLDPFDLERAIAELPPAQRTIIRLRFYLGLTFAEIGKNLSISINTAASRCRYALSTLRRNLRPAAQGNRKGDPS